ncbi:hypothetical protein B0H14DRAFT_360009 [Mycena olivaceomarginata]|nr:hypothetical protein B0H14DRAFT_360009 [Mycena olivaceomarginata]
MSSSSLPIRSTSEPPSRRPDGHGAPFFMHDTPDSFYHNRKTSADLEAGCLVPCDSLDGPMPDLPSPSKAPRRGLYAAYRRWFSQRTTPQIQLPVAVAEKGGAHANANPGANTDVYPDVYRDRASKFERRLQAGSWCAMVVLMLLTIYFLMRETS